MKETRFLNPEFRASTDESGKKKIGGYAAVFDKWSDDLGWFREKIQRGAFSEAIGKGDTVALFNHDSNMVLGRQSNGTLSLREDDNGLYMEVELPDTQVANDLYKLVERGDIKQQSFGFIVETNQWTFANNPGEMDERTIVKVRELVDVSPVTFPAYPDTTVAKRSREQVSPGDGATAAEGAIVENEDIDIDLLLTRHTRGMR